MFGPDNQASITTGELRQLVEGIRFIERMLENPVDKNTVAHQLAPVREIFTKSVVAAEDLGGNGASQSIYPKETGDRHARFPVE
jgi:N-acetylneuraminate synthase